MGNYIGLITWSAKPYQVADGTWFASANMDAPGPDMGDLADIDTDEGTVRARVWAKSAVDPDGRVRVHFQSGDDIEPEDDEVVETILLAGRIMEST
jgi:hypothetical protein